MNAIAGIDLGTTYSSLAALNEIGKPEIIPDFNGHRVIPSVVAFGAEGSRSAVVGTEAKNKLSTDPTDVVQFVKRKMSDPSFRYEISGSEYSPVEVSAMILKKLKEECVQNGDPENVVITVPAHFNEVERKSTMDAGEIAGFNVLGVVNEPTAAALYYASLTPMDGNVVVYDLGGGTFDVTILNISGSKMDVLASKGDGYLGGVDFDNALTRHLVKQARSELNANIVPDSFFSELPTESNDEMKTYYKLMDRVEQLKKQLSVKEQAKRGATTFDGKNVRLNAQRIEFEEMISSHIVTTEMLLENALEDANLSVGGIDKVILVGGSTRIPMVSRTLEQFFGFAPEKAGNPDEVVALGAAIMAGKRMVQTSSGNNVSASVRSEVGKTSVLECANKCFGTLSIGINEGRNERMLQNTEIIRRGTKLPCQETGNFATTHAGQKRIKVEVTESKENGISDPEFVTKIGEWLLDLPPNCPERSPVNITYGYSEDQRLKVEVELPDGKTYEGSLKYDDNGNLGQSEMEKASAKMSEFVVE